MATDLDFLEQHPGAVDALTEAFLQLGPVGLQHQPQSLRCRR